MSHLHNMVILSITKKYPIGADLECIKPMKNVANVVPDRKLTKNQKFCMPI